MAATTFLQLIGSPSENFYLLGKEDKLAAPTTNTSTTPPPHVSLLNFFLKTPVKTLLNAALKRYPTLEEHLTAYAEGRGKEVTEVAWPFVLPDFYPLLLKANQELPLPLASSATFLWPYQEGLAHFKTWNASFALTPKQKLRLINFAAPHYPGILTWSYPGHPYPQGQAWTSEGLVVSWHHLPTDNFNPHGQVASELIWQVLNNAHDLKSMKAFLKNCQVFGALSIIVTTNDDAAQVICVGEKQIWHPLKTHQIHYFNRAENLPLKATSLLRPLKEHYLQQKKGGKKFLSGQTGLAFADLWPAMLADQGLRQGPRPPFLPFTATALAAILPQEQKLCLVDLQNLAPTLEIFAGPQDYGLLTGENSPRPSLARSLADAWATPPSPQTSTAAKDKLDLLLRNKITGQTLPLPPYTPSPLRPFLGAMQALQNRDHAGAAAYFDLAVEQAQGGARNLALFFQQLNQYFLLSPQRPKAWMTFKKNLRTLRPKLPLALQDHATLFIFRINTILEIKTPLSEIHTPLIRRVLRYEQHLPPAIFLQVTRFLTQLRPDILDVIYPHAI